MTRTGFELGEGEHQVRIVSPKFYCQPMSVTIRDGQHVMLILDYAESITGSEIAKPELYFH